MKYLLGSKPFVTLLLFFSLILLTNQASADSSQVLKAISNKNWSQARTMLASERDPTLNSLYEYFLYTDNSVRVPFASVMSFLRRHPHWPDQNRIKMTAERNIAAGDDKNLVASYFSTQSPLTGEGIIAYAAMMGTSGQFSAVLNKSWVDADITSDVQQRIFKSYGQLISRTAHERRLDNLLFKDQSSRARALASLLGNGYPELVEARLMLAKDSNNAEQYLARVPANLQKNAGLLYERLRWRRRNDMNDGAVQILQIQPNASEISNIEDWWKERNILIRRYLENKNYSKAYQLASAHGSMDGQEYAEAEWIAGWLSLRFLNDPARALGHFQAMQPRMKTPISKSRSSYWSARALDRAGRKDEAIKWYQYAAQFPRAYYGQLAAKHLNQPLARPVSIIASQTDRNKIQNSDLGRAIILLDRAGLDGARNKFIKHFSEQIQTAGEFKALAELMMSMKLPQEAIKVSKEAAKDNILLNEESYPVLPSYYQHITIDRALAHAITRQESQFDQVVRSPAGALGLMQLMPATAREVAQKNGINHEQQWLTSNPRHNIELGSLYLAELLRRFDGAHPMAMAAYNAGPSRVNGWIKEFGDPRKGEIDWVDWIELIPISETRNYVQRVTEGYMVYRDQLGVR
jgi:soluble lytic murein transglycosylase